MKKIFLLLLPLFTFGQVKLPSTNDYYNPINTNPNINNNPQIPTIDIYGRGEQQRIQQQNQQFINETQQRESQRDIQMREVYKDLEKSKSNINYNLPSHENQKGTEYYRQVYDKMLNLNIENYSVKDVNFDIENAYFENKQDKAEFDKVIKQSGEFIIAKMKELNYDQNSNSAKNFMLFQFFSQTLQLKGFKQKHFPLKYDFDDYWGKKDWSKMFVTKLLKTGTGQCHSLPLLYLTLAEEIGAIAYLSVSPNHSYIKFQDEKEKWYNLELTNGMFTVSSFILNNGFIRAEAMQNKIYMQNLSKKELLSQFYADLASGYLHKFGYDEFVAEIANKALELSPNSINANMVKANCDTARFQYVTQQLQINPENKQELQKIRYFPEAISLLKETNAQYQKIDDLGYQFMPSDAYEKWLGSLKGEKSKQDDESLRKQFKGIIIKKTKG
jgi:hypothetical protein